MTMEKKKITVLGAGLVGSLISIYLAKKGYKVDIYERRPDMRKSNITAGRSINLALSDRGWLGLGGVGLIDDVEKVAIPMYKRIMHGIDGSLTEQAYGVDGQAIYSVSRGGLNKELMTLAEKHENVTIHFNERCDEVDMDRNMLHLVNTETNHKRQVMCEMLIGADGAYSALRQSMQKLDRFNFSQSYIEHGYKELEIPCGPKGEHLLEKNALHIWPREDFMMIALPNMDGSFTVTLFLAFEGEISFSKIKNEFDVHNFFKKYFPDAIPLMPHYLTDFMRNPTSSLAIMRCYPWSHRNRALLIGDAAHAIVPFYGQGMNAGFEDCRIFNEIYEKHNGDWDTILPEFEKSRKPNGDAIAQLALDNFIEMRDKVADAEFLLRKKIEAKIYEKYPEKWIPLYSMVTFSPEIPYSIAYDKGKQQDKKMDEMRKKGISLENLDWNIIEQFLS
jgi:kynurenine 3-monooxygenase